ncbi:hypothetical protein [Saccharothrix coeruleofusca]|uniref:Uncharacterized protein n=1 Tax=Saccharothrix coeruleofusca TaxID=33919 RepID=A0A918AS92_9PSEU|nr:hypothetical protein [Saccharothrix coeruleofusca]GGP69444.1 hypothetical protein GCM10010185_47840 [Saccharothrix coeruleofusca]
MVTLEGAWSAQSMQAMAANMRGLKQAAESGSFAISESGAQAYIKAIEDAQSSITELDAKLYLLTTETKLGASPDSKSMSRYNLESATGGTGTSGIIPAIDQLKTALEDAKIAMRKAVENYRAVDDAAANNYKSY